MCLDLLQKAERRSQSAEFNRDAEFDLCGSTLCGDRCIFRSTANNLNQGSLFSVSAPLGQRRTCFAISSEGAPAMLIQGRAFTSNTLGRP